LAASSRISPRPKPAATSRQPAHDRAAAGARGCVAALSAEATLASDQAARATTLAESVLHVDAASPAFRDIATRGQGRDVDSGWSLDRGRPLLERAAIDLSTVLRAKPTRLDARDRCRTVARALTDASAAEVRRDDLARLLRAAAILIAFAGLVDPAITSPRPIRRAVSVVTAPGRTTAPRGSPIGGARSRRGL
jgi:hypothetical protein